MMVVEEKEGSGEEGPDHNILKLPRQLKSEPGKAENLDYLTTLNVSRVGL